MRKILLAAVALMALPAYADEIRVDVGEAGVVYSVIPDGAGTNPNKWITCEVLGASGRTAHKPHFMEMYITMAPEFVKPAPGWCMPYVYSAASIDKQPTYEVNPDWPINLGKLNRKLGVRCTINDDKMGFTCDWPPYGVSKGS